MANSFQKIAQKDLRMTIIIVDNFEKGAHMVLRAFTKLYR